MLRIDKQLERGALVCPETRKELVEKDGVLTTYDGLHSYVIEGGVPILPCPSATARARPNESWRPPSAERPRDV